MNNCSGCIDYEEYVDGYEDCMMYNENGSCPCTNCIVKVVCEDPCDKLRAFVADEAGEKFCSKPFNKIDMVELEMASHDHGKL